MTMGLATTGTAVAASCVKVAAGGWHTIVLRDDGTIASWGGGEVGQLGHGGRNDVLAPTTVGALGNVASVTAGHGHSLAVLGDGSISALPVLVSSPGTNAADPAPPPSAGAPWFYQIFGADCRGASQP